MWKEIPGLNGDYSANDETGQIRGNSRRGLDGRRIQESILKPFTINSGYDVVYPRRNGKTERFLVHRLMARTFLPNYTDSLEVNHIDGNKRNNVLSNLEMITRSENIKHSIRIGLTRFDSSAQLQAYRESGFRLRQLLGKRVAQIDPVTNEIIRIFETAADAAKEIGVHPTSIPSVIRRKNNLYRGFKWIYLEDIVYSDDDDEWECND